MTLTGPTRPPTGAPDPQGQSESPEAPQTLQVVGAGLSQRAPARPLDAQEIRHAVDRWTSMLETQRREHKRQGEPELQLAETLPVSFHALASAIETLRLAHKMGFREVWAEPHGLPEREMRVFAYPGGVKLWLQAEQRGHPVHPERPLTDEETAPPAAPAAPAEASEASDAGLSASNQRRLERLRRRRGEARGRRDVKEIAWMAGHFRPEAELHQLAVRLERHPERRMVEHASELEVWHHLREDPLHKGAHVGAELLQEAEHWSHELRAELARIARQYRATIAVVHVAQLLLVCVVGLTLGGVVEPLQAVAISVAIAAALLLRIQLSVNRAGRRATGLMMAFADRLFGGLTAPGAAADPSPQK